MILHPWTLWNRHPGRDQAAHKTGIESEAARSMSADGVLRISGKFRTVEQRAGGRNASENRQSLPFTLFGARRSQIYHPEVPVLKLRGYVLDRRSP